MFAKKLTYQHINGMLADVKVDLSTFWKGVQNVLSRYEQFSFLISVIYRHIQKIERDEMIKRGFKGSFAQYLAAVGRFPDGVTSAQLCEMCDKDKAAVSRAVTEMEAHGLIRREADGETLYRARLMLTAEGREMADYVAERARLAVREAGKGMSEDDRRVFYTVLDLIASNLQWISKTGLPEQEEQKGVSL